MELFNVLIFDIANSFLTSLLVMIFGAVGLYFYVRAIIKPDGLFSFRGRLGRQGYISRFLISAVLILLMKYLYKYFLLQKLFIPAIFFTVMLLLVLTYSISTTIKRLHDCNLPGWIVLIVFIIQIAMIYANIAWPDIASFIITLLLFSAKGTDGPNKYGPKQISDLQDNSRKWGIIIMLERYFSFSGRISRQTFIRCYLFTIALNFLLIFYSRYVGTLNTDLNMILTIVITFIQLSLVTRRCHDLGYSWLITIAMLVLISIPFIALLPVIYLMWKRGQDTTNMFGPPVE